jgi:hypothetical protein
MDREIGLVFDQGLPGRVVPSITPVAPVSRKNRGATGASAASPAILTVSVSLLA